MIATHLVSIELEQMEVRASPLNKRLAVAATLRRLQLRDAWSELEQPGG